MFEATISYTVVDDRTGNDKNAKVQYICENNESFSDVEEMLYQMFGEHTDFEVAAIKRSKIKEIVNKRESDEDLIWMAELQDAFHTDEGDEKYIRYKVIVFAKTFDSAKAKIVEYMKQGFDMTLVSLKLTKFEDVI